MDNKCYLVTDDAGGESALVDASFAHKSFVDEISSLKDNLKYIFLTHGHYDHILSVAPIKEATEQRWSYTREMRYAFRARLFSRRAPRGLISTGFSRHSLRRQGRNFLGRAYL